MRPFSALRYRRFYATIPSENRDVKGLYMEVSLTKCALCGKENDIRLSHIIPKLVFRHMKETAPGYLRSMEHPNATVQDGEKHNMLCGECEGLFSRFEKSFADNFFHPYMKVGQRRFEYDTWLSDFMTSLSWRNLYLDLIDFVENHVVGIDALESLINSEKIMHDFLLGKRSDLGDIEHHIFFFDDIEHATGDFQKLNPHASIHRSVGGYTAANEETGTYFTISNILGIVLITLYKRASNEEWVNTEIIRGQGTIESKDQAVRSVVGNELISIMQTAEQGKSALSEKQQAAIKARFEKAVNSGMHFPIFDDIAKDRELKQ
jgi:hypothetical protein